MNIKEEMKAEEKQDMVVDSALRDDRDVKPRHPEARVRLVERGYRDDVVAYGHSVHLDRAVGEGRRVDRGGELHRHGRHAVHRRTVKPSLDGHNGRLVNLVVRPPGLPSGGLAERAGQRRDA